MTETQIASAGHQSITAILQSMPFEIKRRTYPKAAFAEIYKHLDSARRKDEEVPQ
jgi:hypothetical protein